MVQQNVDKQVIELYLEGMPVKTIKSLTDCADVYKILNKHNIEKNRKLSEELKDAVVSDYLSGVTTREIVKKHKTYELYSILNERGIEYKQNNDKQKENQKMVIELYLNNVSVEEIIKKTGYKDVYKILKKFNIDRTREPKNYIKNRKEERNLQLIEDYKSGKYSIEGLKIKYCVSANNIYRILKVYNIEPKYNTTHHWVIHQKARKEPHTKCKFYILEDYYGYTKIGITTKSSIRDRFRKEVKVFYELDNNLGFCYDLEIKMKKLLKEYIPTKIDRTIDGWSECYTLSPDKVITYLTI